MSWKPEHTDDWKGEVPDEQDETRRDLNELQEGYETINKDIDNGFTTQEFEDEFNDVCAEQIKNMYEKDPTLSLFEDSPKLQSKMLNIALHYKKRHNADNQE